MLSFHVKCINEKWCKILLVISACASMRLNRSHRLALYHSIMNRQPFQYLNSESSTLRSLKYRNFSCVIGTCWQWQFGETLTISQSKTTSIIGCETIEEAPPLQKCSLSMSKSKSKSKSIKM